MNAHLHPRGAPLFLLVALVISGTVPGPLPVGGEARAQDGGASSAPGPNAGEFVSAIELLPESTAGLIRVGSFPAFCEAFDQTGLGRLLDDPLLDPFVEAQRAEARSYLDSIDSKVGLTPQDLYDVASGEVVAAWLSFPTDRRRPYALSVVADVRGMRDAAEAALEKIDKDLKAQGAARADKQHRGQSVRIYTRERAPGQIKIEKIALALTEDRIIAADRESVVTDLLDAIDGELRAAPIGAVKDYQTVTERSRDAIAVHVADERGESRVEWFAKPFEMGRIVRKLLDVDRGNRVDILKLLENQGFDAVQAAGGVIAIGVDEYDFLHRGVILAPPTTELPSRYELGARVLQFPNAPLEEIPAWVGRGIAKFSRWNWKMEEAFWAAGNIVDEAFDEELFRTMVRDIKEDEAGPQIDIENNVLPNLADEIVLITDNTMPATLDSERMLIAIAIDDADAIERAVRKMMEVEPNVTKLETLPGVEVWVVDRDDADVEIEAEDDLFKDLGLEEEVKTEEPPPLLDRWAISLVRRGDGVAGAEEGAGTDDESLPDDTNAYLMFSSHSDLLVETAKRYREGATGGLADVPEVQRVATAMKALGAEEVAYNRVVRPVLSLRAKYQLLRQGKLRELDSVGASLLRRVVEPDGSDDANRLRAAKLPPIEAIEEYFKPGGGFLKTTDDGWTVNGFILK